MCVRFSCSGAYENVNLPCPTFLIDHPVLFSTKACRCALMEQRGTTKRNRWPKPWFRLLRKFVCFRNMLRFTLWEEMTKASRMGNIPSHRKPDYLHSCLFRCLIEVRIRIWAVRINRSLVFPSTNRHLSSVMFQMTVSELWWRSRNQNWLRWLLCPVLEVRKQPNKEDMENDKLFGT